MGWVVYLSFLLSLHGHPHLFQTQSHSVDWKVIYLRKKAHAAENQARLLLTQQERFKVNRAQMWYQKISNGCSSVCDPLCFSHFVLCYWSTLEAASAVSCVFSTQTKSKPKWRQAIREASIHGGMQIGIYGKQDGVRPQVNRVIQLRWRAVHVDMPGQRLRSPKTANKMATVIGESMEKYGWLHNTWAWFIAEHFHFYNASSYGPLLDLLSRKSALLLFRSIDDFSLIIRFPHFRLALHPMWV